MLRSPNSRLIPSLLCLLLTTGLPHSRVMLRVLAIVALATASQATVYNLLRNNQGEHFFDAFQYFGAVPPTPFPSVPDRGLKGTYDFVDNSPTPDFLNSCVVNKSLPHVADDDQWR